MEQIGHSELKDTASYRHSLYLSKGSKLDDVYALFKGFKCEYFIIAQDGDDVIGYIEWGKRQPKGSTIKKEDPEAEWYVRDGKAGEVVEILRSLGEYYEEGEQEMGKRLTTPPTTPTIKVTPTTSRSSKSRSPRKVTPTTPVSSTEIKEVIREVIKSDLPTMCEMNELEKTNKKLVEQVDKVEKALQESKSNEEKLRGEVLELMKEKETFEYQVKSLSGLIQKMKKEKESLEIQAKKVSNLGQECDDLEDELMSEKERNKTLAKRVDELENEVIKAKRTLGMKNEKLEEAKMTFTEGYENLRKELEAEREEMARYRTQIKKTSIEYGEKMRQKFQLECQEPIRRLQEEKENLSKVIGEKDNEIKELKARLAGSSEIIKIFDTDQEGIDGQVALYVGEGIQKGSYLCYQEYVGWLPCEDKPPKKGAWYSVEGRKVKDRQGNWVLDK